MAQGGKGARQGADHVSQATCFGKGDAFGSDEDDIHECGTSRAYAAVFRDARYDDYSSLGPEGPSTKMRGPTCKVYFPWEEGQRAKGRIRAPPQSKPKLGQHFLASEDLAARIVDALGDVSQSTVLEIGPGRGIMTSLLARRARRLIAVELDRVLAAQLRLNLACRGMSRSLKPTFWPSTSIPCSDRNRVEQAGNRTQAATSKSRRQSSLLHYVGYSCCGCLSFPNISTAL